MKMLMTAIALTIATPALAQTAAPADAHSGHHAQAGPASTQPSADPHAGHKMGGMMSAEGIKAHCEKMKAVGKTMDGCGAFKAKDDPHADHDMSSK